MRAGTLTCRRLVEGYLRRIEAYDKDGPAINAITVVNPDALATADSLDRRFAATRQLVGPLHCVPMIVKDNFQTIGLQTAAGNIALKGYTPSKDAFEVKRIKEAGAIVLAKSNMAEFAFSPVETVNSRAAGLHKESVRARPRDRGLVGRHGRRGRRRPRRSRDSAPTRATRFAARARTRRWSAFARRWGSTSRAGIAPLSLFADIAGPMARSVADAVAVFQVVAGYDPDDAATAPMKDKPGAELLGVAGEGRSQGRADRRASPGVRGTDGGSRSARRLQSRARRSAARRRHRARHGGHRRPRFGPPVGSRRAVQSVLVRDQPVAQRAGAERAAQGRRFGVSTQRTVSSVDSDASRGCASRFSRIRIRRRAARGVSAAATRCATRSRARWTRSGSTRSSIRRGAIRRA